MSEAHDHGNVYGSISRKAESIAAHFLNDGTISFMLYVHFALNKDEHRFALSPKALYTEIGISEKQYRRAVAKLEEAGYLVRSEPGSNIYKFYELPPQYRDIKLLDLQKDAISQERTIYPQRDISPEGERVSLQRDRGSIPTGGEGIPLEGERNNTNTTDNNTSNNTGDSIEVILDDLVVGNDTERQDSIQDQVKVPTLDKTLEYLFDEYGYGRYSITTDDEGNDEVDFYPSLFYIPGPERTSQDGDYDLPF